jgi:hypothetical protein
LRTARKFSERKFHIKEIKTKSSKDLKLLDKAANLSTRMKDAAIKTKSSVEAADRQADQTQDAGYNIHELYIAVPKRICHLDERACTRCGKMYRPGSGRAKYCTICRGIIGEETAVKGGERRKEKLHQTSLSA